VGASVPKCAKPAPVCGNRQVSKHKKVASTNPVRRGTKRAPLEELHTDLGEASVVSKGGVRCFTTCTNRVTSFRFVNLLRRKSGVQKRDVSPLGGEVQAAEVGGGTEFVGKPTKDWCKASGTQVTSGGPCGPEQNGRAERTSLAAVDVTRTLRKTSGLGEECLVLCLSHATHLLLPTAPVNRDSSFHALHGRRCDLGHIRAPGRRAWFHAASRKRLGGKGSEGATVGCDESNPRRCCTLDPAAEKTGETVRVSLGETVFPARCRCFGKED